MARGSDCVIVIEMNCKELYDLLVGNSSWIAWYVSSVAHDIMDLKALVNGVSFSLAARQASQVAG